jgi:hypothetical protein
VVAFGGNVAAAHPRVPCMISPIDFAIFHIECLVPSNLNF